MKKQLLFIAVLLCACLAGSCKDDDPAAPDSLYMHSTSGTVEAVAGTQSVTIYTTCGWKATGDDWITIEPLSGGERAFSPFTSASGPTTRAHCAPAGSSSRPGPIRKPTP